VAHKLVCHCRQFTSGRNLFTVNTTSVTDRAPKPRCKIMANPVAITSFADEAPNRGWREQIIAVSKQVHLLTVLFRSAKVPWLAKAIAGCSVAYVFSPIQLIPSFIPIIGQLDDLAVLFIGTKLTRKLTPEAVLHECEAQSESTCTAYLERWRHNGAEQEQVVSRQHKLSPVPGDRRMSALSQFPVCNESTSPHPDSSNRA
jgi:uncharacterized membrane protein YkvA (DUF1232 family)